MQAPEISRAPLFGGRQKLAKTGAAGA